MKDIFSSDNSNMLSSLSHSSLSAIGDKNPRVTAGRGKLPLRVDLKNNYCIEIRISVFIYTNLWIDDVINSNSFDWLIVVAPETSEN